MLSGVWLFATSRTLAHQAPLFMEFSRQEYWSGLSFPPPGDLPNPRIQPMLPALAGRFFAIITTWEDQYYFFYFNFKNLGAGVLHVPCTILVPQLGIEPVSRASEVWILNQGTTREVPRNTITHVTQTTQPEHGVKRRWHFQSENIPTHMSRAPTDNSFRQSWCLSSGCYVTETSMRKEGEHGVPVSADRNGVHHAYPVQPSKRRRIRYRVSTFWDSFAKRALSGLGAASCCLLLLFTLCPTPTHPQESAEGPPPQGSPPMIYTV